LNLLQWMSVFSLATVRQDKTRLCRYVDNTR
jgi:hypothetical protein